MSEFLRRTAFDDIIASLEELKTSVETLETQASASASDAQDSADLAEAASDISVAIANFEGNWIDLTGALNIPASVQHQGAIWILLQNLADVTQSEPSDSNTDWLEIDIGDRPVRIRDITGNPYVLDGGDEGRLLIKTSAGNVQIPTDATFDFPEGTTIAITTTAGAISIVGDTGVTVDSFEGANTLPGNYATCSVTKVGENEWLLTGLLE